jgi:hypothetical protein
VVNQWQFDKRNKESKEKREAKKQGVAVAEYMARVREIEQRRKDGLQVQGRMEAVSGTENPGSEESRPQG